MDGQVAPLLVNAAPVAAPAARPRPALYLVEADRDQRIALYRQVSNDSGRIVRGFAGADALIDALDELEPGVVLLDLPDDDLGVLQRLRRDARFAVVLMSAAADVRLAVSAMRAGALNLLQKPVNPDELIAALDDALAALSAWRVEATTIADAQARVESLSPRERDMLAALAKGRSNKQIGLALGLSARTVETYRRSMMNRLGAPNLIEALNVARRAGAIS